MLILISLGPLAEGNQCADMITHSQFLVMQICQETDKINLACCHQLHHLNAQALWLMHHITKEQARQIVKQCAACVQHLSGHTWESILADLFLMHCGKWL